MIPEPRSSVPGPSLVLRLDQDEPGPDGLVHGDACGGLGLQLRDRRAHVLVDDSPDILRAERRPSGYAQIGDEERGESSQYG